MEQAAQTITIPADGATLIGTWYPASDAPRASLLLHGATGVPQRFYRHFAAWASARGINVLTYDYRDFGASQTRPMRESQANFADWAVHDQTAALDTLAKLAPTGPLWVLGHSLGGLGLPFQNLPDRVTRITTIGAGIGHYTDHPWSYRPKVLAFWFALGPVATALAGYMPGKRLSLGADLPAGVYWQWRRWCTRRDFYASDIGVTQPEPNYSIEGKDIRICVAADDVVVPPVAVRRYAEVFASSDAEFRIFDPANYGLPALKHIEALSKESAPVWADLLDLPQPDLTCKARP